MTAPSFPARIAQAVGSLGLAPVPVDCDEDALDGTQLCAVMAAPDLARQKLKLVAITDFSTFGSVEYGQGIWIDLDAELVAMPAEEQHQRLRALLREAARGIPIPRGHRAVPFSL